MLLPDWAFVSRGIEIPTIFAWARGVLIAIPTLLGDGGVGEAVGGLYIKDVQQGPVAVACMQ